MGEELKLEISDGPVVVGGGADVVYRNDCVALIHVDLATKRAVLLGACSGHGDDAPRVLLYAGAGTLHAKENSTEEFTEIKFLDFPGWGVFAVDGPNRYTLAVVLHKEGGQG